MILNYKIKIFTSNFILKKINKNIKNLKNISNTRFAPEAGGNLHIGHIKSILFNIEISKIYNGLSLIRIDDTNPVKNKKKYKKNILNDINWFKIFKKNFQKKIFFTSNYFYKIYQYIEYLTKKKWKKKINLKLKTIRNMRVGKLKEKRKVYKIILNNNFIKTYRVLYKKHFRTKYFWFIYPLYDYSNVLADKIENIKYSLCTLEFLKNKKVFNLIKNKIYNLVLPVQIEFSKLNFKNNLTSKRLILKLIKNKYIKNHKDKRLLTISAFKNLNINKYYFISFCKKIQISKNNKNISKKLLINNLKPKEIEFTFFYIKNPIYLIINNFEENRIKKIFYKKNYFFFSKFLIIEKNLFKKKNKIKIKKNKKYLLKNTNFNVIFINFFKKKSKIFLNCNIFENKKKKYKIINWLNKFYKNIFLIKIKKNIIKNNSSYIKKININFKSKKKIIIYTFRNTNILNFLKKKIFKNKPIIFFKKNNKNKIYNIN